MVQPLPMVVLPGKSVRIGDVGVALLVTPGYAYRDVSHAVDEDEAPNQPLGRLVHDDWRHLGLRREMRVYSR